MNLLMRKKNRKLYVNQQFMKVALVANIFYSVTIDFATGRSITKFFNHINPLKSRSAALTFFLMEACLNDHHTADEIYATVSAHYLRTNERCELTNTLAWQTGEQVYLGLEAECDLYRKEGIKVSGYALYNPNMPQLVTLVHHNYQNLEGLRNRSESVLILANDYSIFFKKKKQWFLIA